MNHVYVESATVRQQLRSGEISRHESMYMAQPGVNNQSYGWVQDRETRDTLKLMKREHARENAIE